VKVLGGSEEAAEILKNLVKKHLTVEGAGHIIHKLEISWKN
jgi:hypothetical protein